MSEKNKRPVNLNLMSFKFPLPALVSIAHRISGVLLFLLTPILLYIIASTLGSASHFMAFVVMVQSSVLLKLLIWLSLLALIYHLLAGIRHLVMDMGFGESFVAARLSASILFVLFLLVIVLTGVWIW